MNPGPEPELAAPTTVVAVAGEAVGARTGDAYQRLSPELFGFLARSVRDVEVAADLLGDLFTRLLVEERRGRWPEQPRPWLYRVAANLVTSRGRHLQVVARADRTLRARYKEPRDAGPDIEVLRRERRTGLDHALGRIHPDARVALLLAAQGYDGVAISHAIGRSENATRVLMCRARVRLRELLGEMDR